MVRLRIKELAEEQKISQSRLQREAGITMPQLRRYWKNDSESVVLDALDRIARVLGVRVADLFEDDLPETQGEKQEVSL
jgi:transcriptional regulator with XRE-family HTH domain